MHSFPSCGLPLIEHDQKDVEEYPLLVVTWEVVQGGHPHPPLNDPENDRTIFNLIPQVFLSTPQREKINNYYLEPTVGMRFEIFYIEVQS